MKTDPNFLTLREELAAQGFFERTPVRIIGELVLFVCTTIMGVVLLVNTDETALKVLAMWLIMLSGMGVSTNAHTASHGAISHRPWLNRFLTYFGFPFFLQVSATYWYHKHLVVHHPRPNVIGIDDDADLSPFFVLSQHELKSATGLKRWLYRYQWVFLPVLLAGNAFNVVVTGWVYLLRKLADPGARSQRHWLDLGALVLHLLVWVGLPMLFFAPIDVIAFNLVRLTLMSYAMFTLFAPAHFPAEAAMLPLEAVPSDILLLQALTTVNFRPGWLGRLLCAGVDYQIEHHLFPSISHVHYPKVSPLVRAYCEKHGYPYRTFGWWEAIWKSLVTFYRPKPLYPQSRSVQEGHTERTNTP